MGSIFEAQKMLDKIERNNIQLCIDFATAFLHLNLCVDEEYGNVVLTILCA
jgi:hypothetical protein